MTIHIIDDVPVYLTQSEYNRFWEMYQHYRSYTTYPCGFEDYVRFKTGLPMREQQGNPQDPPIKPYTVT